MGVKLITDMSANYPNLAHNLLLIVLHVRPGVSTPPAHNDLLFLMMNMGYFYEQIRYFESNFVYSWVGGHVKTNLRWLELTAVRYFCRYTSFPKIPKHFFQGGLSFPCTSDF